MLLNYSDSKRRERTAETPHVLVQKFGETIDEAKLCGCNQILVSKQQSITWKRNSSD
jgi:hypothetical protein